MKKVVLLAAIVMATQAGFSQGLLKRLHFGLKGGANYSNFTHTSFDTEGLTGHHGGLIVNLKLTGNLSIQEEFLYSTQGARIKSGFSLSDPELKLSYMSVPIMLK